MAVSTATRMVRTVARAGWKPCVSLRQARRFLFSLVLAILAYHLHKTYVAGNLHAIVKGQAYRSAQFSQADMVRTIRDLGIRTVVNLRGCNLGTDFYEAECRATAATGVSQEDITLSANRFPPPRELREVVAVFDRCEKPLLLHCKAGSDRTGLCSALYLLLHTDATMAQARLACSPLYGHFRFSTTARMDEVLDFYEGWLAGREHAPALVREWVMDHYEPGRFAAKMAVPQKIEWSAGKPLRFTATATNASRHEWNFRAGTHAGVHLRYLLTDTMGEPVLLDRAGEFFRVVPPGESIDLAVCLPPVPAGEYMLQMEMADKHLSFSQMGVPPTVRRVTVR